MGQDFDKVAEPMIDVLHLNDVEIAFVDMPSYMKAYRGDVLGLTIALGDSTFLVYIKRGDEEYSIQQIIAHELIHVDQDVSGRYQPIGNGLVLWNGWLIINPEQTKYEWLPWEVEARKLSKSLIYQSEIKK